MTTIDDPMCVRCNHVEDDHEWGQNCLVEDCSCSFFDPSEEEEEE